MEGGDPVGHHGRVAPLEKHPKPGPSVADGLPLLLPVGAATLFTSASATPTSCQPANVSTGEQRDEEKPRNALCAKQVLLNVHSEDRS